MAVQGDSPVLEEILRDFYSDLESLEIGSITPNLFAERLIDLPFKQKLNGVAKESKSKASELYLDHLIKTGTIQNLKRFCDLLDQSSEFLPNHGRWAGQLRERLNQFSSVPSPVSIDESSSSLPQEQQECQDENPQQLHPTVTRGEVTQAMPTTIDRKQKVKQVYDIYLGGEVSLPSQPDLEDEFHSILENLEQLLQAKPENCKKVRSVIQIKHPRYIHGVRQTPLPFVPDTPEELYEFIASRSSAYEIFLVLHAAEKMENKKMNKDLRKYKKKLNKFLEERLASCEKRNIPLPYYEDRTHMALVLSEEQVLLSLVFRLKEYFTEYLGLSVEDTVFKGFTEGCTTLFFSILRVDAVLLAPNVLSHSGELRKFKVTHVFVFGYFICDLDETTVELLHGSEARITQLENELSVKASELDQTHHNQIATNLKLKEAKAKVAEAEKEKAKLRGEVNKSKQEADKLKHSSEARITQLENELSVKASELEKVHQDKIYTTSKLEAKVADAEKENEIKSAQIAKLQDKVSESRQEAEKLKAVNDSLKVGIMLSQRFPQVEGIEFGNKIAGGRYGDVYEGTYRAQNVAVKRINNVLIAEAEKSQQKLMTLLENFRKECSFLIGVANPHIVRLLGVFSDTMKDGGILLVMEPMYQTLENFLEENRSKLLKSRQLDISHQIASGLQFLHQSDPQIIHGNLTPRNILLDKAGEIAKLSDSGQSKFAPHDILSMKQPGRAEKGDVLALGLNFLRIATQDPQIPYLMEEVGTVQQWKEDLSKIAKDHPLKQLIQDCLKDNVEKRPTVNDVCRQLSNCGVLNLYKELKKNESKIFLSDPLLKGGKLLSSRLPDLPIPTCNATALIIGCKIYVGGGICPDPKDARRVQVYDTYTCEWDLLPPAPLYRSKITLVKGQLTLLGGRDPITKEMKDATSTWDEEKKQWFTKLPPMPKIRMRPCIIHCKNLMVVAGGKAVDNETLYNDVDVLNTDTLEWFHSSSLRLPLPMYLMRTSVSGGYVYISSGWKTTSSSGCPLVYRIPMTRLYDAIMKNQPGEWMQVKDTPYLESPLVVDSSQPLVVGGHSAERPTYSISIYNPDTNQWSEVGEYVRPCLRSSPIAISSSSFIVIGGCTRITKFNESLISDFQLLYLCQ